MTTIATPPAAALDAVLDRVRAGKALTPAEADLLSAGITGLRRTAGGLQRRSQQQAARIAELESLLHDRIADAIRAATCPGECDNERTCRWARFQPTVWGQDGRVIEVEISGPIDRIATIIAGALARLADARPAA
ncbi:hypothetical protein ACFUAH_17035 [Streptomyces albidoflavus]|uniref:hypothetical protein n=1 Tax=Streptomyces albidoflavus TaxID=1886 RepID=UPI000743DAE1|nr:hypothetical protein [Streptomyces albidoflavus]KUL59649.1 hypothetical protein ADL32_18945 [Streptomyces albidoflavus]